MTSLSYVVKIVMVLAISCWAIVSAETTLFPQPKDVKFSGDTFKVNSAAFIFQAGNESNDILESAFQRYYQLIFRSMNAQNPLEETQIKAAELKDMVVNCLVYVESADDTLKFETDESYKIDTTNPTACVIHAKTVYGALRGLETFSQLIDDGTILHGATIDDTPRFKHRGFMMDTCRHFYPVNLIYQLIDAMSYNKLNVLHWHIVDDQSFPYQSRAFPELSTAGAFSPRHVYSQHDIYQIQKYAKYRGIRVIFEFDTPGHVTRGYNALLPKVLTDCYNVEGEWMGTGPLNPTIEATYEFLNTLYDELKDVSFGNMFHVGGDEVLHWCWMSNPQIKQWMVEHPEIPDFQHLEMYFIRRLLDILKSKGMSYTVWQEILDHGAKIQEDTVVQVWRPTDPEWRSTMTRAHKAGFNTVLSSPYYYNLISYGADWKAYYEVEPTDFEGGPEAEASGKLMGIEGCMWSEFVDATNFIARTFPRLSTLAERAWSTKNVRNISSVIVRLHNFRCRLIQRGINAEPFTSGADITLLDQSWCPNEWNPRYSPMFT